MNPQQELSDNLKIGDIEQVSPAHSSPMNLFGVFSWVFALTYIPSIMMYGYCWELLHKYDWWDALFALEPFGNIIIFLPGLGVLSGIIGAITHKRKRFSILGIILNILVFAGVAVYAALTWSFVD